MSENIIDERAELVKAALLGTQRYDLIEPDAESPLGKLYSQLDSTDSPHRLLTVAGAYFLRQRAGEQPDRISTPSILHTHPSLALPAESTQGSTQSSNQTDAACNKLASQNLAAILWGYAPDLLSEFLSALAQHNLRIPEQYLPTVLARGAKSVPIRPIVLPVLGPSGRWLATQNPLWAYATERATTWDGAVELLKQLTSTKRQGFLRQLRRTHPTLARDILSNQWKSTTSSERALFIKMFDESLGMEDEQFLELALDDRNNVVRRKAAELLAKLPDSQLCKRMTENTDGFLNWTPEKEHGITVVFPAEITPQLVKDGVMIRTLRDESRVRAHQMKEIVGAIPLAHWTSTWAATPAEIIAAAQTSRWPRTLKQAFVLAAERQKNIEWAMALLASDGYKISSIRLINLLPIEECETILIAENSAEFEPLTKERLLVQLLRKRKDSWTVGIATLWFDQLVQHLDYDISLRDIAQRAVAEKQNAASLAADNKAAGEKNVAAEKNVAGEKNVAAEKTIADAKSAASKSTASKSTGSKNIVTKAATQNIDQPKTVDPILRLLIRQSGRCAPVEMTPQIVKKLHPYIHEFTIWQPILQEVISTLKFRQTMLENIKG